MKRKKQRCQNGEETRQTSTDGALSQRFWLCAGSLSLVQKLRVSIQGPPGSWESCGSDLQRNGEIKAETEVRDRGGGRGGVGSRGEGCLPLLGPSPHQLSPSVGLQSGRGHTHTPHSCLPCLQLPYNSLGARLLRRIRTLHFLRAPTVAGWPLQLIYFRRPCLKNPLEK